MKTRILNTVKKSKVFMMAIMSFVLVSHSNGLQAQEKTTTVVLVHGAFADGSSWNKIIPILQEKGYNTIAVQNPLTSLADDVKFVNRVIEEVEGDVILVGHSWAGVVITEAGNNEKVKSLVYVSAFAPQANQSLHDILDDAHKVRKMPNVPGFAHPIVSEDGYIRLSEQNIVEHFAQDLPEEEAKLIAATQGRFHVSALDGKVANPAWKNKTSYFVVSEEDHMIAPQLLKEMAKNIGAKTYELKTSHVPMLSQPKKVVDIIIKADK